MVEVSHFAAGVEDAAPRIRPRQPVDATVVFPSDHLRSDPPLHQGGLNGALAAPGGQSECGRGRVRCLLLSATG